MIGSQITESIREVQQSREKAGIDPSALLVLEFNNEGYELDEAFVQRFGARIVDERETRTESEKSFKAILQFTSIADLTTFEQEVTAYGNGQRATLPRAQRQDFLDSLKQIRSLTREDRMGERLRAEGWPDEPIFMLDIDLWHPGDNQAVALTITQFRELCGRNGAQLVDDLRTASLLLLRVRASRQFGEILLDLDAVASVDLSPLVSAAFQNLTRPIDWPNPSALPDDSDPLACVIDSGVIAGHPLLAGWVTEERDFDSGEDTPADRNGHGTAVAGLVAYGDVAACIEANHWQPRVRICSAKILRNKPNPFRSDHAEAIFPEDSVQRIETVVEKAIRYFHRQGCRIFNLSLGDAFQPYADQRQFSWAEVLDNLIRELDILVVVPTGNFEPPIPSAPATRNGFMKAVRDQTLDHRLLSPATAALALTVGSLARYEGMPERTTSLTAGAPAGGPSPFSRTGPGYAIRPTSKGIKPDLSDFGGNYALQAMTADSKRWVEYAALGEPSIDRDFAARAVKMFFGTSFAAPRVTHAAAIAEVALRDALGYSPPANLIRATVGASATIPEAPQGWYSKNKEKVRCDMIGYGRPRLHRIPWSTERNARLIAADYVDENKFHLYRIPIPEEFLEKAGRKGLTIALAYDPPVRGSRKEYLARTMFFEPIVGLTSSEVESMLSRFDGAREDTPNLPPQNRLAMAPGSRRVAYSTLQVRRAEWFDDDKMPEMKDQHGEPSLHVAVFCQRRFLNDPVETRQSYGLVIDFEHDNREVHLYQHLRANVRQRIRQQSRL